MFCLDILIQLAVEKLNSLQTNAAVLAEIRRLGGRNSAVEFDRTRMSLNKVGIQVDHNYYEVVTIIFNLFLKFLLRTLI